MIERRASPADTLSSRATATAAAVLGPGILAMLVLGLFVRIVVACSADHVHHADEIFQSFEQAHRAVFGYGIVPWEYRFGTRSWLTPGLVAGVLQVCRMLGLTDPGSYTLAVKLVLCGLSASLILSSYAIGRRLGSQRAGLSLAIPKWAPCST
jgi:hypothetical protein